MKTISFKLVEIEGELEFTVSNQKLLRELVIKCRDEGKILTPFEDLTVKIIGFFTRNKMKESTIDSCIEGTDEGLDARKI